MGCKLISYDSPYLESLNLSESEISKANAIIESATAAIEKYLGRKVLKAVCDKVYVADQFGSVVIDNPPLVSVDRLFTRKTTAIELSHTTATNASYATTASGLRLTATAAGATATTVLSYATYPTVAALVAAVDVLTGWQATVTGELGGYASADLVAGQYGQATATVAVKLWGESQRRFDADLDKAIITGEFCRGELVRIVHTSGWESSAVPEPIKEAVAEVTKDRFNPGEGAIQSESLGGYSYSLAQGELNRLPLSIRQALSLYKDRRV